MLHCNSTTTNHCPPIRAALYARVSSEQQAQAGTIDSQVAAILQRAAQDAVAIEAELRFIDEGYSGATLFRPALERLRDLAAAAGIDRLYVLCPDRLARAYAHQMVLVEELQGYGVELAFINHDLGKTPEDNLLLQVQGMVAEYERAKIMERCRRGKLHAARRGSIAVLSGAPYGYRYVAGIPGAGGAQYNVHLEEAAVVQQIFQWVGLERASMGEVCRRLKTQGIPAPRGKERWGRSSVWSILSNPAYKGAAAFGKTRMGPARPRLRAGRNRREHPRDGRSSYDVPAQEWISIAVPAIVNEDLFETVNGQLEENRKRSRLGRHGARYLLQGLLQCNCCGYSYYGNAHAGRASAADQRRVYGYYRCTGSDAHRFGGQRLCHNKPVRLDVLDQAVWNDVRALLADPKRIEDELHRRLEADPDDPQRQSQRKLGAQIDKLRRGMARLIDAYEEGLVDKGEFEPRIKSCRERLSQLEPQLQSEVDRQTSAREMRLVIENLETFAQRVTSGLDQADWTTRQEIIRTLVKRIEIAPEQVKVVYKVNLRPFDRSPDRGVLHYCPRRASSPATRLREHGAPLRCYASASLASGASKPRGSPFPLDRSQEMTTGTTDTPMIASTTSSKCFWTKTFWASL
jgi:site-specific DNA recombinase